MKETHPEVKAGILIFVAIVILFIFTFMIGKFHFFKGGYSLKVTFNFVEGLDIGAPVRVSGVKAGNVTDVQFDSTENLVMLTLWLNEGVKIRDDSKFYLNTLGLMGEKYIEIDPGVSSKFLKPGTLVKGEEVPRFEELIRRGQQIVSKTDEITSSIRNMIGRVSLDGVGGIFSELKKTMSDLNVNISRVIDNLVEATSDIKDIISEGEWDVQTAISKLKEAMIKLERTTTSLNTILDKVEKGEGTIGVLLNDKQVANDIKEIIENFKVFSQDIKDNPSWLIMGKPKKK